MLLLLIYNIHSLLNNLCVRETDWSGQECMIFLSILMGHIIEYLNYCCCCCCCFFFLFLFLFNFIIKAKFHSKLYMMIIVHFFLANWSLMLLLTPQLTLLRNFVFTMIYFPPHVNANQSSLTYKTFGYYLRRATELNGKVKKT